MEIARGYAAFANGGYLIEPYFIARIEDQSGDIVEYANRAMVCADCITEETDSNDPQKRGIDPRFAKRIISSKNAFIMDSLMQEVVRSGTARAAMRLGRNDLAGKTGTTNNYFDAWFTGYNPDVVTSVWVGYDNPKISARENPAQERRYLYGLTTWRPRSRPVRKPRDRFPAYRLRSST